HRYISERQLPDKAVSVLDTACARVALGQVATPSVVEAGERRLQAIATEVELLERERLAGSECRERLDALAAEKTDVAARLTRRGTRGEAERQVVRETGTIRQGWEGQGGGKGGDAAAEPTGGGSETPGKPGKLAPADLAKLQSELKEINAKLAGVQGE